MRRIGTCFCRQCAGRGRKHETNLCDHAGVWLLFEADDRGFPRAGGQSHLFDHRGDRRGKDHHPGRHVFCPLLQSDWRTAQLGQHALRRSSEGRGNHGRFCLPVSGHDVPFYALAVPIHRAWNRRAQDKGDARLLPDGGRRMGASAFRCGVPCPGEGGGNFGPHLRAVFPGHRIAAGRFLKIAPVQFAR